MINWLTIIFTEWLVLIYYFHSFSTFPLVKKTPIMKILARCQFCLLTEISNKNQEEIPRSSGSLFEKNPVSCQNHQNFYNSLNSDITSSPSSASFKRKLKEFLLSRY